MVIGLTTVIDNNFGSLSDFERLLVLEEIGLLNGSCPDWVIVDGQLPGYVKNALEVLGGNEGYFSSMEIILMMCSHKLVLEYLWLRMLSDDNGFYFAEYMLFYFAKNPNISEEMMGMLTGYGQNLSTIRSVAENANLPEHLANRLVWSKDTNTAASVVHKVVDPELLKKLSKHEDKVMRGQVYRNKFTPIPVLVEGLLADGFNVNEWEVLLRAHDKDELIDFIVSFGDTDRDMLSCFPVRWLAGVAVGYIEFNTQVKELM